MSNVSTSFAPDRTSIITELSSLVVAVVIVAVGKSLIELIVMVNALVTSAPLPSEIT